VGVVTLTFVLLLLAPGDPAARLVGPAATPAQLAAQRHALGLDRSLIAQFTTWVARAAQGDWGTSIATGRPVRALLGEAWPATVRLVGLSLLLSYILGLVVGAVQAAASRSRLDTALSVASVTLFAIPGSGWADARHGLQLRMGVLPAFGAAGPDADLLTGWVSDRRPAPPPGAAPHDADVDCVGGTARFVRGRTDVGTRSLRPRAPRAPHRRV
jgi:peptide/nickel transport system permease protein